MANKTFVVQYIIKARDQYARIADKVSASTNKMRKSISRANVSFQKFSASMRRGGAVLTAFATAPILLMANSLKNAARDAQETRSKFKAVFKDIEQSSEGAATKLAKDFGLARSTVKGLLGDTGDLLTGFGFTQESALDLSVQVNKLAVDLASFTNFSGGAKGASEALTKALLGERESVKSLGIAVLEKDVKTRIAILVAKGQRFETERQAKAIATFQIMLEQSKNAIGDYSRTQKDLANQERKTSEAVKALKEDIGTLLLPMFLKINKIVQKVVANFRELSPETKKMILIIGGIVAAAGPLLLVLGSISLVIPLITAAFTALAAVAVFVFSPIGIAAALVATAAFLVIDNWDKVALFFDTFADIAVEKFLWMKDQVLAIFNFLSDMVKNSLAFKVLSGVGETVGQLAGAISSGSLAGFDAGAILGIKNKTDVNVNVGLDKGLKQTAPASISTIQSRNDTGMGALAAL